MKIVLFMVEYIQITTINALTHIVVMNQMYLVILYLNNLHSQF